MDQTTNENNPKKRVLTNADMVKGIGRKTTDKELIEYLSKDNNETISLKDAFRKFINNND